MRLINARTYALKEFGWDIPPYAILSHTWGDEEVTLQDMSDLDIARKKDGFVKIERCCQQALRDGLEWAWVDICCIDKASSAELSETINSMFKWYEQSMRCYAVLSDINTRDMSAGSTLEVYLAQHQRDTAAGHTARFPLFASRWWTRGWTLQELIAPYDVGFYSQEWHYLTSKQDCKGLINARYGIPLGILDHSVPLASVCVAERMSWAGNRYTTQEEDMAYCLLGIFNVNMPLLYGEGSKSFLRLQEQIIGSTEDYTLLLWGLWAPESLVHLDSLDAFESAVDTQASTALEFQIPLGSILATSPRDFGNSQAWSWWTDIRTNLPVFGEPLQITSRGLRLTLYIKKVTLQDLEESSQFSRPLDSFFRCLSEEGYGEFVSRARAMDESDSYPLYLGAFQSYSRLEGAPMPCVLLLSINVATASSTKSGIFVFARLMWFIAKVGMQDAQTDDEWKLQTCYIKTRTDNELHRQGLSLERQTRPWQSYVYKFWTWRTPDLRISQIALNVRTSELETRRCLLLKARGGFPGCLVLVAACKGNYWMAHKVGNDIDINAEAARLETMDLGPLWVKTAREVGPLGHERVDFESGALLITLMIYKPGLYDWYRVSLALIEN